MNYPSPPPQRSVVHRLEAVLLETPAPAAGELMNADTSTEGVGLAGFDSRYSHPTPDTGKNIASNTAEPFMAQTPLKQLPQLGPISDHLTAQPATSLGHSKRQHKHHQRN